jgi:AraC-like DNA-binding protein
MAHHDPAALESAEGLFPGSHSQGLSRAYLLQRLLLQRLKTGIAEPLAIEEAVLGILGEVAEGCGPMRNRSYVRRRDPARSRRGYAEDAKALLQDRFREPLRLDDVAQALHVSPYHLCRLFKAETGVPVHRYLNRLRLRHALEGIAERDVDLTHLAFELGFSSHSHFTSAFRKEFGVTPREARRLARSGPGHRPAA